MRVTTSEKRAEERVRAATSCEHPLSAVHHGREEIAGLPFMCFAMGAEGFLRVTGMWVKAIISPAPGDEAELPLRPAAARCVRDVATEPLSQTLLPGAGAFFFARTFDHGGIAEIVGDVRVFFSWALIHESRPACRAFMAGVDLYGKCLSHALILLLCRGY